MSRTIDKRHVGAMFDSIARTYDFLNHMLSFGIDRRWRKKTVEKISESFSMPRLIDVATGTGDLAIEAVKINPIKITGIDISEKMLEKGKKKIGALGLENIIELLKCEPDAISFEDNTFDAAMAAFGVRNFSDPLKGLSEMTRVVRPGGMVVILEFSKPEGYIFKQLFNFYFKHMLPFMGAVVSGHRSAYKYLNESVTDFADGEEFLVMMQQAGLKETKQERLTMGIASIYTGVKDQGQ